MKVAIHSSALNNSFKLQMEPFLQSRDAAKRLRIYLSWNAHPVDGCAICEAVDAHSLISLPGRIRRSLSEPQDSPFLGLIDLNEATLPGGSLKRLKAHRSSFLLCLVAPDPVKCLLMSFPIEKFDANSGTSIRTGFRIDVGDASSEDSVGRLFSRYAFGHVNEYTNRQPYKYWMARDKVDSS